MDQRTSSAAAGREALVHQVDELAALYRLTDRLYRAGSISDIYDAALDALRETLGCARASILLFDEGGVMRFVAWRGLSEEYRKAVDGHTPWTPGERDPQPIFVPDIDAADEADWIKATIRKEGIRSLAFIPLVAQGGVIGKFMTYYATPRDFAEHEKDLAITIARQVGFSLERARAEAARQAAENELRESEERFRLMSEHAPVMIWMSDPQGACLHLNRMLRSFWGVPDDGLATFNWQSMMHPDDAADIGRQIGQGLAARANVTIAGRYRDAAGRYRVLQTDARPRFSATGEFLGMIGVNVDVTEREETLQALRESNAHRATLLAELNHRVKNTLAVVQGIAHQTFKDTATTPQARKAFEGRLIALAAAHDLLTRTNWENASLEQLASDTLQARSANEQRVAIAGPCILLPPKEALAIAMALHELCTNAVKYGALSNDAGRVTLDWNRIDQPEPRLKLIWRESGGPAVAPPLRRGFGTLLLERTLAHDLNGQVSMDYHPEGLVCAIEAPLPEPRRGLQ